MTTSINQSTEIENIFESRRLNQSPYFKPTLTIFKNALVINYKKVGTRFMGLIGSIPNTPIENKVQIDLYFHTHKTYLSTKDDIRHEMIDELGVKNYIYTSFDVWEVDKLNLNGDMDLEVLHDNYVGFNLFKSTNELLQYENVNSLNELLFENQHKDIILVLRNPIKRYVSGAVQILYSIIDEIPNNQILRNQIKFFTNLTDNDLEDLYKKLRTNIISTNPESILTIDKTTLYKLLKYLIETRADLMFSDIHTENYLAFYLKLINKIKDKTKIKIIDIDDCNSNTAYKFFDGLRGDSLITNTFDFQKVTSESNKPLYELFIKFFVGDDVFWNSSMRYYLEYEYYNYDVLINTSYYIDLKKKEV